MGFPSRFNDSRSPPGVLPDAADGMPPKVSEFPEAGFRSTSLEAFAPTFLRVQYRAGLNVGF